MLANREGYHLFEQELERVRQRCRLIVTGYILMPEDVHLLISEPPKGSLATAIQALKHQSSRKLKTANEGAPSFRVLLRKGGWINLPASFSNCTSPSRSQLDFPHLAQGSRHFNNVHPGDYVVYIEMKPGDPVTLTCSAD